MTIGAHIDKSGRITFSVWAPFISDLSVKIVSGRKNDVYPLTKDADGFWKGTIPGRSRPVRYFYHSSEFGDKPDPASMFQPQGVHGPSQVIDHSRFRWKHRRHKNTSLKDWIIYELHVGTFTRGGTFRSAIGKLDYLRDLGVNAVEVMPVAQFPGERNWGYDGTYLFAVQNSYGGPDGFKSFVDACHRRGIAVILDVVYNHFGPEGNYCGCYAPYFTDKHHTPWGKAVNFDDTGSRHVRDFMIQNALYWFREYHVDGLRLDAIHAIIDDSPKHILQELKEEVEKFARKNKRKCYLIAESDLNDSKIIRTRKQEGYGLDAQWSDDFHHSLHALLTGEDNGYYKDFGGEEHLLKAFNSGFVYSGQYSKFRRRVHGNSSADLSTEKFVVYSQNHDQVGNRMLGERLSALLDFEAQKLVAGAVILSPYIPLLFMGEEYGETRPFLYFVSHSDKGLIEAVRRGRKEEFSSFLWKGKPRDPQDKRTYRSSKLDWKRKTEKRHRNLFRFYQELIRLRKKLTVYEDFSRKRIAAKSLHNGVLRLKKWYNNQSLFLVMNFSKDTVEVDWDETPRKLTRILDSGEKRFGGKNVITPARITGKERLRMGPYGLCAYTNSP